MPIAPTAEAEAKGAFATAAAAELLAPSVTDNVITDTNFHAPMPPTSTIDQPKSQQQQGDPITPKGKTPPLATDAKCYAFMGASGGSGVTTLCIQMAYEIASRVQKTKSLQRHMEPSVCLIDLDFETGACASYLDVPPSLDIADICGPADRIDKSLVQALMSTHECGISVLSTPNALGANSLANPETVLALLDAAVQMYDHVILDLPRIWQPWIGAAISGADHFAIVSELTVPSLHTARSRLANIEKVLPDVTCEVVLNKVERRSFRNSLRLGDAEKALKRTVSSVICTDQDTAREAINCGQAIGIIRPEARYVKDVKTLCAKWVKPEEKTGFFGKDRRKKRA
jgi:pilus assembly protein CpaE